MTIPVQVPRNTYTADGVQGTFAFTYRILVNADMRVFVDSSLQQEGVDYNLVGVTELGGDVVFVNVPSLNTTISLARSTPESQAVVYNPFDPFPAKTHEAALDKLTMIVQEVSDVSAGGNGLPLDPTGIFWEAGARQIKNLNTPAASSDAANKSYVDAVAGDGGFDPTLPRTITGNWIFTQAINGITSGNLTADSLLSYTRNNIEEAIQTFWTFVDGAGSPRKVAARNPRERLIITDDTPSQADEGAILRVTAVITSITLEQLEPQTTFTILAKSVGYQLLQGTGVTIHFYDGGAAIPPTGDRTVVRGSVLTVQYEDSQNVSIWGNGIA